MKKVAFHNLGCKVNAYETEVMIQQLQNCGYEIVPFEEIADIYVINTCTVTNMADRKSRQMLHRAKKRNPDALVVAVGCYVQADPEAVKKDMAVDILVGNDQKGRLAEILENHENALLDLKQPKEYEEISLYSSSEHTRAILKIQDGCNQFCSYCLIPYVRGRVRSRRQEEVLKEAERLAENGFQEIVLTGIHLSSYGLDFPEEQEFRSEENFYGTALARLIGKLAEIPGISRIRLGSLEPRIITESFVQALKDCGKICPHFHLSLQSGSDTVLKRMNRHYTRAEYEEKCRLIRQVFDHPAITTDVIVGFPGETEEEFQETVEYLNRICFYETHIFKYSRRKGTKADRMPGQVPEPVKNERSQVLLAMTEEHSRQFREFYLGKEVEVLLEEKREDGRYVGHTREYVKVSVDPEGCREGMAVTVTVTHDNLEQGEGQ
ncbi:MAG: tRNA (N(6)-L-threonylcarbamoyladenosine(37)-C(2))-methylthiotransferase MtaB [Clostridiales bacterium]|nr:tRNA (N(6)-L-threonylcarbamoyladenosine(37)-C(2))-methylthiotransferase MtaB [Clostridiales bacterium]